LFLVPGCTLSVILKAYLDGHLKEFWDYHQESLLAPDQKPKLNENEKPAKV